MCESLHKREGALRETWDLQKFLQTSMQDGADQEGDAGDGNVPNMVRREQVTDTDHKTFKAADAALKSCYFWSYLKFILIVEGVLEDLSRWAEACPCHGWSKPCPLRGRRAPEAACGAFDEFIQGTLSVASSMFVAAASGLAHSSREWRQLSADWQVACDLIEAEMETKCAHWRELPWLLCGVAHPNSEKARAAGRKALLMFDDDRVDPQRLQARRHRMSARFLSRAYRGCPGSTHDIALRPLLEDFVAGGGLEEPDMKPLREWLGALRLVRIVERATEATPLQIKFAELVE